jgi:hypothetical protein
MKGFLSAGGKTSWAIIGLLVLCAVATPVLAWQTATMRYNRDLTRMVFNDNLELLEDVKLKLGLTKDSLHSALGTAGDTTSEADILIVSISDHRVWYRQGHEVLFSTRVATGSGRVLSRAGGTNWKFETPRGRLVVQSKESDPVWVPPDWHYVEVAKKKKLGLARLVRGKPLPVENGAVITVAGNDVVKRFPDGREEKFESGEGKEIVAAGKVVIPPFGTNQRKFVGALGTHRLNLGDGYALHGTDVPSSIGQSVSHGCIRLRNEDIETLYRLVPTGTPVYIY